MAALKALAASSSLPPSQAPRTDISTNDAVAGLVWTLMTHLRGRPLPGSSSSRGCLGLAVDLRRNGLKGVLPLNLFGNATWCLHVPSAPLTTAVSPQTHNGLASSKESEQPPSLAFNSEGIETEEERGWEAGETFVHALRCGARKVRDSLVEFRGRAPSSGWGVLDLAEAQCRGPLSAQVSEWTTQGMCESESADSALSMYNTSPSGERCIWGVTQLTRLGFWGGRKAACFVISSLSCSCTSPAT